MKEPIEAEDSDHEYDTSSGDETEITLKGGAESDLEEVAEKGEQKKALDPTIDSNSSDDDEYGAELEGLTSLTDMEHELIKRRASKGVF